MFRKTAEKYAAWLIENGQPEDNREIFVFGFLSFIYEALLDVILFTVAAIFGFVVELLIWHLFYLPLRFNLGGFHTPNSALLCTIISIATALGCVFVLPYVSLFTWILWTEIIASILIAFLVAPVINPNRLFKDIQQQRAKMKKNSRIISIVESAVIIVFFFAFPVWVAQIAALGMFVAAIMCLIGKFTTEPIEVS